MADAKITELVAGTLSSDDLLTFVDDPSGTPVNKKIAYSSFLAGLSITESQISDLGTYLSTADIDTLAELNAIVADDTIIGAAATDASSFGFVVDEDNLASNLDTKVPTQQSVKAYVDSVVAGLTALEAADIDTLAEINAILGDATLVTVEATDASGYGWVIDEDDMTSDSATKVPTQQSVKAYVDAEIAGVGGGGTTLPVADTTGIAKGSVDATKIVRLEVDGLTTATTRVLTVQDADGTIALTGDNIAASQITSGTLAHERGGLEADVSAYSGVPLITGGATSELKFNLTATVAPTVDDDVTTGYSIGSRWIDVTADREYVCLDATDGAAVWTQTSNRCCSGSGSESAKTLTDGATITIDQYRGDKFKVTLGGNRTIALTNPTLDQKILVRVIQDGTGSRTLSYPASVKWPGGTAPTLTTTANASDWLGFYCVDAGTPVYHGFTVGQGYSA